MTESEVVNAFNRFFVENAEPGIAYRRKQHRFSSQFLDILVDTASDQLRDIGVEHKSFKTSSSRKLYFSQHFSEETEGNILDSGHQIDMIDEFRKRSGRDTFLAVEVRQGSGNPKRLFFVDWDRILQEFKKWRRGDSDAEAGFDKEWLDENGIEAERSGGEYGVPRRVLEDLNR